MPRNQIKTKCGVCHIYKGIYVKTMIDGVVYWVCLECLEEAKPDHLKNKH